MNYRHAFHAGGFTDVVKHAVLVLALARLKEKPTPLFVLDTHAGIGRYDLWATPAQRTGEYRDGIARLVDWPEPPVELTAYLETVRGLNRYEPSLRWYPGSPELALALLARGDRLVLCEVQSKAAAALEEAYRRERRVTVHSLDGYAALKAFLPPKERRGLVLIDPPFEAKDEFGRILRGLKAAYRRWPTGVYVIWYPIKHRPPVADFHRRLAASGMRRLMTVELLRRPDDDPAMLNGCGLVVVNPPWPLRALLGELMPPLGERLGAMAGGTRVKTLVGE